ncbi:MAG TPA: DUF4136 domain-containing protein [Candidatus Latescibacteria bacterium]|jgi:hypothetical protein|nr:hypothetical protein [Gemmatimonadaceae bacterium]MDP6015018.1 DUF4136 domain-containing protein [Candidatus Latescibacterota bacterium]HJP29089.1 DUF4136 domain-containing protein [Candidatus Latescibacterota bacterium]
MRRLLLICAWLVPVLSGCTAITVQHDFDPDVDFSRYQTFAWLPRTAEQSGTHGNLSGPFVEKRIRKSLAEGLARSGLRYTPESADVLVAYQLHYERKQEVQVGAYGHIRTPYARAIDVRKYREGTLIVDLVDPLTEQLIWRGWGISDLQRAVDPQEEQELIDLTVQKILERYPPY